MCFFYMWTAHCECTHCDPDKRYRHMREFACQWDEFNLFDELIPSAAVRRSI